MRTVKTLKLGQKGTRELLARFGPSLLNARYRYDEDSREHVKTVELIVHRRSRESEAECLSSRPPGARLPGARAGAGAVAARRFALRIGWRERDLQQRVKSAGGRWDPDRRVWMPRRDVAERQDLTTRVVGGGG